MIRLDYRDARPIYEQVRDGLRSLMVTGVLAAGEKLPSVRSLATELAINPNTIQRAYELLEAEGYAPARYEAWLVVSLGRNRTILESGPDTGEWPDARDRITRIRGGKLTVSDGYGRLSRELEAITADYEAGPDAYAENKAASDEMLREACRVEWIG